MSIGSVAKVIGQITALIVAGLALADAIEQVSERTGITKKELRRLWRQHGPG